MADNFQVKHKMLNTIKFSVINTEFRFDSEIGYWEKFYNPFNRFLGLCNKKELAFILEDGQGEGYKYKLTRDFTKKEIGEIILMKLQFRDQKWFDMLETKFYFVADNGHGITI